MAQAATGKPACRALTSTLALASRRSAANASGLHTHLPTHLGGVGRLGE
jgi:hypothetical protein